ncbi:lycopene cyclase domain-containing protein [Corynebacterium callunae]|uniref:lycopene cyclase domain-containing protein n=1 Tax=Corynebacterium callunae TaxID=1721 RepID=UPI0039827FD8
MLQFIYLGALLLFSGCMVICDFNWKLAFFRDARRATLVITIAFVAFLLWDGLGIVTGTFYRGQSDFMTGVELAPHMPLEEPIFLFFLCYLTLNLSTAVARFLKLRLPSIKGEK